MTQVEAEKGGRTEQPFARGRDRTWGTEEDEGHKDKGGDEPHNLHKGGH